MSLALQKSTNTNYKYYIWNKGSEILKKSNKQPVELKKSSEQEENNKISDKKNIDEFFDYRSFRKDLDKDVSDNDKTICNERLTGRDKLIQRSINPFLSNNNYLSDLSVQDEFLRPKNSSYGKI